MQSMRSLEELLSFLMISGKFLSTASLVAPILIEIRLLDKIAKDIMVCENQTIKRWDGGIGEYKNHLRKKMQAAGAV
jgi:hypothetical protein